MKSVHTGEYFRYIFSEGAISQSLAVGTSLILGLIIKNMSCLLFKTFVRTAVKLITKTTWLDKERVDVLKFAVVSRERNRSKC